MTAPAVRPLLSTAIATLALGGVALAGAPTAYAAPGDNGDIKIHRAGTVEPDQSNHPRVCEFYIAAFNFDGLQSVQWEISHQPATNGPVRTGSVQLNAEGDGRSPELTNLRLANGQYKVEWTFEGQQGAKKSKVFRVACLDDITNPPPNGGGNGTPPPHKPPHGPVGAGGGGSAELASDSSAFGVGSAIAAVVAGTAGLILVRRSRRRTDGAA
ncbi:hypothetical protein [Streptomyces sp. NPDC046712]|uniref:hypothetical protein n=1 Tax=Streptomyces sp. NPDC046712 TaxID=3154802 RepID=UPI0033E63690